ncbi:MAG: hypothetical protein Q4B44_07595 [Erysipelotrichaceae bacterium]|nr:hypothetical protein [Erysipelotrichaceae bacterium]
MSRLTHDSLPEEMKAAAEEAERLYGDLLYMPRPVSKKHPRSSRDSRAAQFSPFAALTGYDDAIKETARLTKEKPELSEEQKEQLDRTMRELITDPSEVTIVYYVMDDLKEGGDIRTESCRIRKTGNNFLKTDTGLTIPLEDILDIRRT